VFVGELVSVGRKAHENSDILAEYGHQQHIAVHQIVSKILQNNNIITFNTFNELSEKPVMKKILKPENKMKIEYLKIYNQSLQTDRFILQLICRM